MFESDVFGKYDPVADPVIMQVAFTRELEAAYRTIDQLRKRQRASLIIAAVLGAHFLASLASPDLFGSHHLTIASIFKQ